MPTRVTASWLPAHRHRGNEGEHPLELRVVGEDQLSVPGQRALEHPDQQQRTGPPPSGRTRHLDLRHGRWVDYALAPRGPRVTIVVAMSQAPRRAELPAELSRPGAYARPAVRRRASPVRVAVRAPDVLGYGSTYSGGAR
jgi:hypothetical protein